MSGKRSLKKQQKRQASALARLEDLYRRGADDELLARAAEVADLAASPFAAKWAEVADRTLRQSLARADLGRIEGLLRTLRRSGPPRPLGILAEGILDLVAGRCDAARSRFAALASAEEIASALPPGLLADLQALPQEEFPREVADLFAALQGLETRGFAATTKDCEALARHLHNLRTLAPAEDADLRRLLDGAERYLSLLSDLSTLEAQAGEEVVAWLRGSGSSLTSMLSASAPPLLAPLHHAVQTRWRAVLERVFAHEGTPGLAALWAAAPQLLAHHVDLPEGTQGSHERLRQRTQAQQLLAAEIYEELARLLRSRSRTASEPGELAACWSLELWACDRWTPGEQDEDDEDLLLPDFSEPFPHRTLVRLGEMAREIGRRFPAGQRAEVARVLRDDLFELCRDAGFCDHTAGAALALLDYQPGDAGLLIAGVAGAVADGSPRILRAFEDLVRRRGEVSPTEEEDRRIEKRLMTRVAGMPPRALARVLAIVKPLFSVGAWPEIAELMAREVGGFFADLLEAASFMADLEPESSRRFVREAHDELMHLRPALGGTLGLAAVELALDCWQAEPRKVKKRLAGFLNGFPGYEGALAVLHVLEKAALSPWPPKGVRVALVILAEEAIDHLDDRWQLWCGKAPTLVVFVDEGRRKLLKKKIQQLLASPETSPDGREVLGRCLEVIHRVEARTTRKPDPPRPRTKQRKKPRRGNAPQISLDFP